MGCKHTRNIKATSNDLNEIKLAVSENKYFHRQQNFVECLFHNLGRLPGFLSFQS